MTAEPVATEHRRLIDLADDLSTHVETLAMLEAQLEGPLPDDERVAIAQGKRDVEVSIEQIGLALATKTDAVAAVLRRLGGEQAHIKAERQRLATREDAVERADKWLRGYVLSVMRQNKAKSLKTPTNTLFIHPSEAVKVADASTIPAEYMMAEVRLPLWLWFALIKTANPEDLGREDASNLRVKAEPSLTAIKKAIKGGFDVPGASIKASESLVVR